MKLAYLTNITYTLLLSVIILGGISAISYQQQTFAQAPVVGEEKLTRKEKEAIKLIDEFLSGKYSWKTFATSLAAKLQHLPQYVSFCNDLNIIANKNDLQTIGTTLSKYQNLLPKPIKAKFDQYNTTTGQLTLGYIISKSFSIKD